MKFFDTLSERPATTLEVTQSRLCLKTITKWYNKVINNHSDLAALSSGDRLKELIEKLTKKKYEVCFTKSLSTKRRIAVCLTFLKDNFGIFTDNLDPSDIEQGNLIPIKQLVFILMEYFCIELPLRTFFPDEKKPMLKFKKWVESKVNAGALKDRWCDGRALGALINSMAPDLCPDFMCWDPKEGATNLMQAMDIAETYFGISKLLTPQEMSQPDADPYSLVIYLAQFLEISPLNAKGRIIDVGGPGISRNGNFVNEQSKFYVKIISGGDVVPTVSIKGPTSRLVKYEIEENQDDEYGMVRFTYIPELTGVHTIQVMLDGKSIGKSYKVNVQEATDVLVENKIRVHGPGVQIKGVIFNRKTYFDVCGGDTSEYVLHVDIKEPNGSVDCLEPIIKTLSNESWRVEYIPVHVGAHIVSVFVFNHSHSYLNYPIVVSNEHDPVDPVLIKHREIDAEGDGLNETLMASIQVRFSFKRPPDFEEPDAIITDEYGYLIKSDLKYIESEGRYDVMYRPVTVGNHTIKVVFGWKVFSKVVKVIVAGDASKVILGKIEPFVVVGEKCTFEVNMEEAGFGFINCHVRSQSGSCFPTNISIISRGRAIVKYVPHYPGQYTVNVDFGGQQVPGGLFEQKALSHSKYQEFLAQTYYQKARVLGPGLIKGYSGQPCHFTVVVQDKSCWPRVKVEGPSAVKISCVNNNDNSFSFIYITESTGYYWIYVFIGKQPVFGSPFNPQILPFDVESIKMITLRSPNEIPLGISEDVHKVNVTVTKPSEEIVKICPVQLPNGSVGINLTPNEKGVYKIEVFSNGNPVMNSPFQVCACDMLCSYATAYGNGLEHGTVNSPNQFFIKAVGYGHSMPTIEILGPEGPSHSIKLQQIEKGLDFALYEVLYEVAKPGCFVIYVKVSGESVKGSPYFVEIIE